jgi:hypothetical protein
MALVTQENIKHGKENISSILRCFSYTTRTARMIWNKDRRSLTETGWLNLTSKFI